LSPQKCPSDDWKPTGVQGYHNCCIMFVLALFTCFVYYHGLMGYLFGWNLQELSCHTKAMWPGSRLQPSTFTVALAPASLSSPLFLQNQQPICFHGAWCCHAVQAEQHVKIELNSVHFRYLLPSVSHSLMARADIPNSWLPST